MKPLILEPIPDYTIWGGDTVSTFRKADKNYGTWWEVSAHPYCTNKIKGEERTLQEAIDEDRASMLGQDFGMHEMLREAFLDAKDSLSIQVHPYDAYALENENDFGKDESWYIIDALPGAKLVAGTTSDDPEVIRKALEDGNLEQYLRYWEVKKGDYIVIPAGMLHALGAGIVALEVGTNSNTTYRFYDYNRKDANGNSRPLHLEKSFAVADFSLEPTFVPAQEKSHVLGDTPFYKVEELYIQSPQKIATNGFYKLISNLGEDTTLFVGEEAYPLKKWETAFIPAALEEVTVDKGAHILLSYAKGSNE